MGLRLIKAACVESSTNFTCIELFPEIGQGVGGLKSAPLYLIMNSIAPSQTPCPKPPNRLLGEHFE